MLYPHTFHLNDFALAPTKLLLTNVTTEPNFPPPSGAQRGVLKITCSGNFAIFGTSAPVLCFLSYFIKIIQDIKTFVKLFHEGGRSLS